jgi:hypothetical protein
MKNPKLEVASWVAGIISAAVVIYTTFPGISDNSTTTDKPASGKKTTSSGHADSSLGEALYAVLALKDPDEREAEIHKLVRVAVQQGNYEFALSASRKLHSEATRDSLASVLSCYLANFRSLKSAREAALLIKNDELRESSLRYVADVATMSPTVRSGGSLCAEP